MAAAVAATSDPKASGRTRSSGGGARRVAPARSGTIPTSQPSVGSSRTQRMWPRYGPISFQITGAFPGRIALEPGRLVEE